MRSPGPTAEPGSISTSDICERVFGQRETVSVADTNCRTPGFRTETEEFQVGSYGLGEAEPPQRHPRCPVRLQVASIERHVAVRGPKGPQAKVPGGGLSRAWLFRAHGRDPAAPRNRSARVPGGSPDVLNTSGRYSHLQCLTVILEASGLHSLSVHTAAKRAAQRSNTH
jgi:hypothetical protein